MKASISVLTTAVIVGVISAASNWVMAAPITYDFTGPVLGNQALGASHTYTAAGGPDITAISGSYAQLGSEAPVTGDGCAAAAPGKVAATLTIIGRKEAKLNPLHDMVGPNLVSAVISISFACAAEEPATPDS